MKTRAAAFVVSTSCLATSAFAQSALVISCGDCEAFEVLEVAIDGQSLAANGPLPSYRAEVTPGKHEVQVWKWTSPFERVDYVTKVLDFPKRTELRVKASFNKLNVYGQGRLEAPEPPPAAGPTPEALNAAADLIAEASDDAREAAEYNEEERSRCQSKVAAKLELIGDNLRELRGTLDLGLLRKTATKASDTQALVLSDCPGRVRKSLGKKVGKIVARLDKASAALR